jgi:hypothetical protein
MAIDEDDLRRVVREEINKVLGSALLGAISDIVTNGVINGKGGRLSRRNLDPGLSAKRSAAAKIMWEKMKSKLSTGLPTPKPKKKKASKPKAAELFEETVPSEQNASKVNAHLDAQPQLPGSRVFLAYAAAYRLRYGEFPVRNAKVNSQLKQLVDRLGAEESGPVSAHYVGLNEPLYVKAGHCLDLLLRDAERLRTLWKHGASSADGAPARPWWEVWSGIEEQGKELGIDPEENPQVYRAAVLRAAFTAGRLPEPIAVKLGVASASTS